MKNMTESAIIIMYPNPSGLTQISACSSTFRNVEVLSSKRAEREIPKHATQYVMKPRMNAIIILIK